MEEIYQHYKGNKYKILCIAKDHETLEEQVVYQGLYTDAELGENPIFVRPKAMFFQEVEINGVKQPRFKKL